MRHLPHSTFRRCVARYAGEHQVKSFSCLDQFLCMAFAQLTYRESLRDIEACLRAQASKLYHFGIRGSVARNTLANANATRDWRIYTSFAQRLIRLARALYAEEAFGVDLAETVYAFDATTIDRKRHIEMSTLAVSALALATFLVGLYLGHRWGGHDARVEANDHKRRFQRILRFAQPFIDGFAEARHWEVDRNAAGEIIDIQPPPIRCGTQAMLAEERHDVRRRQEEMR